jgi:hypothetical protein
VGRSILHVAVDRAATTKLPREGAADTEGHRRLTALEGETPVGHAELMVDSERGSGHLGRVLIFRSHQATSEPRRALRNEGLDWVDFRHRARPESRTGRPEKSWNSDKALAAVDEEGHAGDVAVGEEAE